MASWENESSRNLCHLIRWVASCAEKPFVYLPKEDYLFSLYLLHLAIVVMLL